MEVPTEELTDEKRAELEASRSALKTQEFTGGHSKGFVGARRLSKRGGGGGGLLGAAARKEAASKEGASKAAPVGRDPIVKGTNAGECDVSIGALVQASTRRCIEAM